jgi:hypothetical protein
MHVYVAKAFTAVVNGSRIADVRCERCSVDFHYALERQGEGTANAHYYLFQDAAKRRAERRAAKNLERRLAGDAEPVACPRCNWVNTELVALHRRSRHRWMGTAACIAACVVPLVTLLGRYSTGKRIREDEWPSLLGTGVGGGLAIAAAILVIRWALRRRFDPNRSFPAPPTLPLGTPIGWLDGELPTRRSEPTADEHIVVFHLGTLVLPGDCCECLAPATTTFKQPINVGTASDAIAPPLCATCARRLRGTWWRLTLFVTAAVAILCGLAFEIVRSIAPRAIEGQIAIAVVTALIAWPLGVVLVPSRRVRPHAFKLVDPARSVARIRFRNADYAALVREATESAD